MKPADWPRDNALDERLLRIDPHAATMHDGRLRDLGDCLRAGDLLVVNDAATLPASLIGETSRHEPVEVRLAARHDDGSFEAVSFGAGDWHTPTEHRVPPPPLAVGDSLHFDKLTAHIEAIATRSSRLVRIRFDANEAALWPLLYAIARPVQYAYVRAPLALWHVQTHFASRPWAFEPPSAGRPLTWGLLLGLRERGVRIASVTHAAGLSSTGDPAIDAALPLAERYDIPAHTVRDIETTRAAGGRVIAVGTTVVRALESAASLGLRAGSNITTLRIGRASKLRVVDGLLTGMHAPTESHFELLEAFVSPTLLERAWSHAEREGYRCHEFGDSTLVLAA